MSFEKHNHEMMELVEEAMFFGKTGSISKNKMIKKLGNMAYSWARENLDDGITERLDLDATLTSGFAALTPGNTKVKLTLWDLDKDGALLRLVIYSVGEWAIFKNDDRTPIARGEDYTSGEIEEAWMSAFTQLFQ